MAVQHSEQSINGSGGTVGLSLLGAPGAAPHGEGRGPRRAANRKAQGAPDQLAAVRARKARERASIDLFVENRLQALEHEEQFVIPRLYVVVTGSLGPASALKLIESLSERSYAQRGTPWVYMPLPTWTTYSALSEDDWLAARATLRELGLIEERRRYDLDLGEIVTELAFLPDRFAAEVARVREQIRDDAAAQVKSGQGL